MPQPDPDSHLMPDATLVRSSDPETSGPFGSVEDLLAHLDALDGETDASEVSGSGSETL